MTILPQDLIEKSFVISVDSGRLGRFRLRMSEQGFQPSRLFRGYTVRNGNYDGFSVTRPVINCSFSHASVIQIASAFDWPYVCIFEDDAAPCRDCASRLGYFLDGLPDDIDLLKLGWLFTVKNTKPEPARGSDKYMVHQTYGAHAYVVFRKYYGKYFSTFSRSPIADNLVFNDPASRIFATRENLFIQYNSGADKTLNCRKTQSYGHYKKMDLSRYCVGQA